MEAEVSACRIGHLRDYFFIGEKGIEASKTW